MSFQNIMLIEGKDDLEKTDVIKKFVINLLKKDEYEKIYIFCDEHKLDHYRDLPDYCSIIELYGNDDDHGIIEGILTLLINEKDKYMKLLIFDTLSLSKPFVRFTDCKTYSSLSKEIDDKISMIISVNNSHDLHEYTDTFKDLDAYFYIGKTRQFYKSRCNCKFINFSNLDSIDIQVIFHMQNE